MMRRVAPVLPLLAVVAVGCAPTDDDGGEMQAAGVEPTAANQTAVVQQAAAVLRPASGSDVRGTVHFRADDAGGVTVRADVSGLTPGAHAYHVHEYGDCTAEDATSAGPHYPFVPLGEDAEPEFITGNLGEIEAEEDGSGTARRSIPVLELEGPRGVLGRSVVLHRQPNDTTAPPTGDTGARIACGVIGVRAGESDS